MPFEKGHAKTGGRGQGVANKDTVIRRTLLHDFLNDHWIPFVKDIYPQLSPKEQADFIRAILPYLFPRMQAIEVTDRRESVQTALDTLRKAMGEE